MFTVLLRVAVVLLLLSLPAQAGRGGHYVGPFDPNLYPGAQIWNFVGGGANGLGGTCDGTSASSSADGSAIFAWQLKRANNPVQQVLYVPPGSRCITTLVNWEFNNFSVPAVQNAVMWVYGATFQDAIPPHLSGAIIGGTGINPGASFSKIASVSAGSSTITVTDGSIGNFSAGMWILVSGLELQTEGYPPNLGFFEYRFITSIAGNVITLSMPLDNTYLSTWPNPDFIAGGAGTTFSALGGPAAIFPMSPGWNTKAEVYGGTFLANGSGAGGPFGKDVLFWDSAWKGSLWNSGSIPGTNRDPASSDGWSPDNTNIDNLTFFNVDLGSQIEYDKVSKNVTFYRSFGSGGYRSQAGIGFLAGGPLIQSMNDTATFISSNYEFLVGTTAHFNMLGGRFGEIRMGAGFGYTNNVTLENCIVGNAVNGASPHVGVSTLAPAPGQAFAAMTPPLAQGQFRVANATGGGGAGPVQQAMIPGFKYVLGVWDGTARIDPDTTGRVIFKLNSLTQDPSTSGFIYLNTDFAAPTVPNPTFNGGTFGQYWFGYPIGGKLSQTNCGPANFNTDTFVAPP